MQRFIKTSLFSGLAFGIGVLAIIGGYLLVQAVAPGAVTNPAFGPNDDDVVLAFPVTTTVYSASGSGGTSGSTAMGTHDYCALTTVASGGTDSGCRISKSGNSWTLHADSGNAQTQACSAFCMDF